MKTSILEKALFAAMAVILIYVMISSTKIIEKQQECMVAMAQDLLSGQIVHAQVVCSGAIK